jgi:hypothetical protein
MYNEFYFFRGKKHYGVVIFEDLIMVGIKGTVLWDVVTCGLVAKCRHCEETSEI